MREIHSHTALRGIAALLVVLFHYRTMLEPAFNIDAYTSFFAKSYLWVDCFFILSGFVLCHVYGTRPGEDQKSLVDFLRARFARIYPLHLATLLGLVALQTASQVTNHPVTVGHWSTFWPNLLDIHAWLMPSFYDWNFPSWSISVEFAAYLLFPLVCFGLARQRTSTLIVLAAAVAAVLPVGHEGWEQTAVLRGVPMFFGGILLYQFREAHLPFKSASQVGAAIALAAALHFGMRDALIDVLFATLVLLIWTDEGPAALLRCGPLQHLGNWSFSIYMLHIPVRDVLGFVIGGRVPAPVLVSMMVATTLLAGALSYRYFEMPMRRILRRRATALASA